MTNTNELPPMDEENVMEEGVPEAPLGENTGARQRQTKNRLSVISQKYDVDGDGELDEFEQKMRDMDKSGRGFMRNEDVYEMMQEQFKTQRELFTMKKMVIGLGCFTAVLALSNLATAWAAAVLAKDTQVSASNDLTNKANGELLNTATKTHSYSAEGAEGGGGASGRRGLQIDLGTDITKGEVTTMKTSPSIIWRTCSNGVTQQGVQISQGGTHNEPDPNDYTINTHTFTTADNTGSAFITCPANGNGGKACNDVVFLNVELTTCPASNPGAHSGQCCSGTMSCPSEAGDLMCSCSAGGLFECEAIASDGGGGAVAPAVCLSECPASNPGGHAGQCCSFAGDCPIIEEHQSGCDASGVFWAIPYGEGGGMPLPP